MSFGGFSFTSAGAPPAAAAPAPKPALSASGQPSSSLFGGGFGTSASAPAAQGAPAVHGQTYAAPNTAAAAAPWDLEALSGLPSRQNSQLNKLSQRLGALSMAYDPASSSCSFQHLFYNKVDSSSRHLYACPPGVSKEAWELCEAQNPSPDDCVPAHVSGVESLQKRVVQQELQMKELKEALKKLRDATRDLSANADGLQKAVSDRRMQQQALSQRFLQAMRKVEVLRCMGMPLQPSELSFRSRVNALHDSLSKPHSMLGEISGSLSAYKQVRSRSWSEDVLSQGLSQQELKAIYQVLHQQQLGISHLNDIVDKDLADMKALTKANSEERRARSTGD